VFSSKKKVAELEKKVDTLEQIMNGMSFHMVKMQTEINDLKQPKEPKYLA